MQLETGGPLIFKDVNGNSREQGFLILDEIENSLPITTGTVKKAGPRLRELAPAASGSQDAGSRNLPFVFFDM